MEEEKLLLGRFLMIDKVGAGCTGELYRVRPLGVDPLDLPLCVWRTHTSVLEAEEFIESLARSFKSVCQLDHPEIPSLFETGEHEGRLVKLDGLVLRQGLGACRAGIARLVTEALGPDMLPG
jgi:hypothetical protein